MRRTPLVVSLVVAAVLTSGTARAQEAAAQAAAGTATTPPPASAAAPSSPAQAGEGGSGPSHFVKDVGMDYLHFFRPETAAWYVTGGGAASIVHIFDEPIAEELAEPTPSTRQALEGGDRYGNLALQMPLAIGWWVTGHAMGSARTADAGRDLVRAQINATSWAYVLKFAVNRTRPNGDPRSFPSGHATAVFATAMVLQDHYGWKVGVPFFAGATYTAISRLTANKHWASDVTMGAFVGIASARTVTLHLRDKRYAVGPYAVPGGWGVGVTALQ